MGGASVRAQAQTQRTLGCQRQLVVGRFAIYQISRLWCQGVPVRDLRAQAAFLFIDCKQQTYFLPAFGAQTLGRHNLRGNNALGVASAATEDLFLVLARGNKRWHGVQVRGEHHARRRGSSRYHVEPIRSDFLQLDPITQIFQV